MKCPRCGLIVERPAQECPGCLFSIRTVDRLLKKPPPQIGFVNDWMGALTPEQKGQLEEFLSNLSRKLDGEIVVVLMETSRPVKPSEYVFWLFNRWQVGGEAARGLMILISFKERRVESEVGLGWEPFLSDPQSGEVLDQMLVPWLREGRIYEGLRAACDAMAHIISDREAEGIPNAGLEEGEESC